MPVFVFKCKDSHVTEEFFFSWRECPKTIKCDCGLRAKKTICQTSCHTPYAKPVLSDAMGVHASQVADHRKRYPDVPMTDDGRVVVKSHTEHRRIMKRLGFYDKAGYF